MGFISYVDLVDMVGREASMFILMKFGGSKLNVPLKYKDNCVLSRTVGHDYAKLMIKNFAGEELIFPAKPRITVKEKVFALLLYGKSYNEITSLLHITQSTIKNHVRELRREGLLPATPRGRSTV